MLIWTLSNKGYKKIRELQDKYRFQTSYAIEDTDSAIEFLGGLYRCGLEGLDIDSDDEAFIEEARDKLGCYVEDCDDGYFAMEDDG